MIRLILSTVLVAACSALVFGEEPTRKMLVVVGAPGNDEYGKMFAAWADRFQSAAEMAECEYTEVGRDQSSDPDRSRIKSWLESNGGNSESLWIIFIGHGTSYRDVTKFNLQGADVEAKQLAKWLQPITRPIVMVNCSASSSPFVQELSAPGRVVITATRSPAEQNFARFGEYFSAAITEASSDLDHDDEVSVLEAFLSAVAKVNAFYQQDARLVTEHALLEDNGDKLGISADFYRGARPTQSGKDGAKVDGRLASRTILIPNRDFKPLSPEARQERDRLETEVDQLRARKSTIPEEEYYGQLEQIMLKLARLNMESQGGT